MFVYIPLQRVRWKVLKEKLKDHPDRELVNEVVQGFRSGFSLGMDRLPKPRPPCANSKKVQQNQKITEQMIEKEISRGHIQGPFHEEPYPNMVYSPLNIVPKAGNPVPHKPT